MIEYGTLEFYGDVRFPEQYGLSDNHLGNTVLRLVEVMVHQPGKSIVLFIMPDLEDPELYIGIFLAQGFDIGRHVMTVGTFGPVEVVDGDPCPGCRGGGHIQETCPGNQHDRDDNRGNNGSGENVTPAGPCCALRDARCRFRFCFRFFCLFSHSVLSHPVSTVLYLSARIGNKRVI